MKVLLTGFEPFGGEAVNPSGEAVKRLDGKTIAGADIVARIIPVSWDDAGPLCQGAIDEVNPDIVLMVGQAGGRTAISVERVAINVQNGKDNNDVPRDEQPIDADGPAAYFGTVPVKKIAAQIAAAGIPAIVSNTAGTYLCNHLMYHTLHHVARAGKAIRGTFIHIPFLPEQVANKPGQPSMALETIVRALEIAVETAVKGQAGRLAG
ncbi:MAG: pyroglutamyl-peptidase I [Chloroflexota bacterium]